MEDLVRSILFNPQLTQAGAALVGAFIGVLGSLLVTIAAGLLSRDKFKRERLWERRQEACNTIVSELQASTPFADRIADGFSEDAHRFWGSPELERIDALYYNHINAADSAFQQNYLILPPAFRRRYERMQGERRAWWDAADPDAYLGPIGVNASGLRDLLDLALATLGIAPFWRRHLIRWRPAVRVVPEAVRRVVRRLRRKWRRWKRQSDDFDF